MRFFFFFFKQKTAYEMRISDWSSDVCSSDLVPTADGKLVPLGSVATIKRSVGPVTITHYQQLPAVTISFDLLPGVSLGQVTPAIEQLAAQTLPDDVAGNFAGTAETYQASLVDLPVLLLFSIAVIYMVLAILYEHFIHPLDRKSVV